MKLISLWEPWATLMAIGAKRIETRSWETLYRGWLAIHASKNGLAKAQLRDCLDDPWFGKALAGTELKPGHILAVVKLQSVCRTETLMHSPDHRDLIKAPEVAFGDYHPGRFGWITGDLFRLTDPIPHKAAQGLCSVPDDVVVEIRRQYKQAQGETPVIL